MWKITVDMLHEQDPKTFDVGNAGFVSSNYEDGTPLPFHFRMLDGDGEIYFYGRADKESFAPLDDFGMPDSGCVTIEYFNMKTGEWEVL